MTKNEYLKTIERHKKKYATKGFEDWKKELTNGDDVDVNDTPVTDVPASSNNSDPKPTTTTNTTTTSTVSNNPRPTNSPGSSKDIIQRFLEDLGIKEETIRKVVDVFVEQELTQEVLMTTEKSLLKELLIKDLKLSVGVAAQILTAIENKKTKSN